MASKFYIMNEKNVRWGLNSPTEGVFINPSGFGIEYDTSYIKVGDMWVTDNRILQQPEPSGTIIFPRKQYVTFQKFVEFLNAAKSLVLIYQPSGVDTEYFAEIDLVNIDKGGYNRRQQFEAPVRFACKSLFYTEEKFEYHIERAEKEVRFPFRWETRFNDKGVINFGFNNNGHVESPFTMSCVGYCINPSITVMQDGEVVRRITFNLTLEYGQKLVFSTFDDNLMIEVDGVNRRDCLDFTKDNFFKIPKGITDIRFETTAGKMNNIVMSLEKYYVGV